MPPPFWGSVASTWLLFSSFFRYILSMLFCTLAIRTLRRPINGRNYPFHPFRCLFSVTVPPSVFLNGQQSIRERKTPSEPADALFWRMNCLCIVPLLNSPSDPPQTGNAPTNHRQKNNVSNCFFTDHSISRTGSADPPPPAGGHPTPRRSPSERFFDFPLCVLQRLSECRQKNSEGPGDKEKIEAPEVTLGERLFCLSVMLNCGSNSLFTLTGETFAANETHPAPLGLSS